MDSLSHVERQRASREAKALRRQAHLSAAHKRVVREVVVDHGVLLRWLKDEFVVPLAATRIVGTGHGPDVLTVIYTED
jgi:hypothetical protein